MPRQQKYRSRGGAHRVASRPMGNAAEAGRIIVAAAAVPRRLKQAQTHERRVWPLHRLFYLNAAASKRGTYLFFCAHFAFRAAQKALDVLSMPDEDEDGGNQAEDAVRQRKSVLTVRECPKKNGLCQRAEQGAE